MVDTMAAFVKENAMDLVYVALIVVFWLAARGLATGFAALQRREQRR